MNWLIISLFSLIGPISTLTSGQGYPQGFLNHTGCLFAYVGGGYFEMITAEGVTVKEEFTQESIHYEHSKIKCTSDSEPGKLVFSLKSPQNDKIKAVSVAMQVEESLAGGYWEVSQANLTISRADVDKKRTFPLKAPDMYAGLSHSYSCNKLILDTMHKKRTNNETGKMEPRARLTLSQFQVQPFPELERYVFGASFDCATWLSLPQVMALVLVSFMTITTAVAASLLRMIDPSEFKYNKEGLLFTQSQMESNKRNQ